MIPPDDQARAWYRHLLLALLTFGTLTVASWGVPACATNTTHLPVVTHLTPLLQRAHLGMPVVALFSRADCPWCEALRRDQLIHLGREAHARGIQVVEFDIGDNRAFKPRPFVAPAAHPHPGERAVKPPVAHPDASLWAAASPADLARQMSVRVVPTVVFLGARGELAPRLVGYASRDFYGAYLTQRVDEALAALVRDGRP